MPNVRLECEGYSTRRPIGPRHLIARLTLVKISAPILNGAWRVAFSD